jgi:hypothetical protein
MPGNAVYLFQLLKFKYCLHNPCINIYIVLKN